MIIIFIWLVNILIGQILVSCDVLEELFTHLHKFLVDV